MSDPEVFACKIDHDMAICGGPTEVEPEVGQDWMNVRTGSRLPVWKIVDDGVAVLGSTSYQLHLRRDRLWRDWVLMPDPPEPPSNLRSITEGRRDA